MRTVIRARLLALLGAAALGAAPRDAAAFCNQTHNAWDPCYDSSRAQTEIDSRGSLPPAECSDLELTVALPAGETTCEAANISDADARARAELVIVDFAGGDLAVEYLNAGIRTYIERTAPSAVAEDAGLRTVGGERGGQFRLQDFDVRRYAQSDGSDCVAFARNWGHVPKSPGYRYRVAGIYCAAPSELEEAKLNRVLAGIQPGG